jgi:glutamate N-acetyltransferase/amino-acid N-acetyltransferase
VECDEYKLVIKIGDVLVYDRGDIVFTPEIEEKAHKVMKKDSFKISVNLGIGESEFTAYGCDLSYEYVKINAEYRT